MKIKLVLLVLVICQTFLRTNSSLSFKEESVKDDLSTDFSEDNGSSDEKQEPVTVKAKKSAPPKILDVDFNESDHRPNDIMRTKYGVYSTADIERSYARMRQIFIRSFLIVGQGVIGHGAGIFTALLAQIINKQPKPIWQTLEPKIDRKLRKAFTKNKMEDLVDDFRLMILMMGKTNLSMDNLNYILSRKSSIFPQDHSTTTFTASYIALMRTYLYFVSTAYMNIMAQGKLDACAFARELTELRGDIINGAKQLYKMRYKELVSVKEFNGQLRRSGKTYVIFRDTLTNEDFETWIINTKRDTFDHIQQKTKEMIQDLITDCNDLLDEKTHNPKCKELLSKPITDAECTFSYPLKCYGTLNGGNFEGEQCALPCGAYKEDGTDFWCFDKRIFKKLDDRYHELREGYGYIGTSKKWGTSYSGQWDWCSKASFDECMPVKKTRRSRLSQDMVQFE